MPSPALGYHFEVHVAAVDQHRADCALVPISAAGLDHHIVALDLAGQRLASLGAKVVGVLGGVGGTVALVMPLSLMSGESWTDSRKLLADSYSDLVVVSIAGAGADDMSFSADTGMGECLVVGRKSNAKSTRATFAVLNEKPANAILGAHAAKQIRRLIEGNAISRLEDGPSEGGTHLHFGEDSIGKIMSAPLPPEGGSWNLARVADLSLAQSAYQLATEKRIWLPTMSEEGAKAVPITTLEAIGHIGPIHRDINGRNPGGGIRGPFDIEPIKARSAPTYPVLWAHDAERERTMAFPADSEGIMRRGSTAAERATLTDKVAAIWETASHCHVNCDFQFNSQSTGMQFTPHRTIGGRAWISVRLATEDQEKALVLWANTSFGMLLRWWQSNKQQAGRGNMGKLSLQTLAVLDVTKLKPKRLAKAVALFDDVSGRPLLPLHEADRDAVRQELDERFAADVLGLDGSITEPLRLLREKLVREPSVRGNK